MNAQNYGQNNMSKVQKQAGKKFFGLFGQLTRCTKLNIIACIFTSVAGGMPAEPVCIQITLKRRK